MKRLTVCLGAFVWLAVSAPSWLPVRPGGQHDAAIGRVIGGGLLHARLGAGVSNVELGMVSLSGGMVYSTHRAL
jgi:hypothetical protein